MNEIAAAFDAAIRYSRGESNPDFEAMTKAVVHGHDSGDLLPVGVFADWLEERGHPLAPIVRSHWDESRPPLHTYGDLPLTDLHGNRRFGSTGDTREAFRDMLHVFGHRGTTDGKPNIDSAYGVGISDPLPDGTHDVAATIYYGPKDRWGSQRPVHFYTKMQPHEVKSLLRSVATDRHPDDHLHGNPYTVHRRLFGTELDADA